MTAEQLAQAYAETIYGPANGWGQHVHPTLGRSDYIMHKIHLMVGADAGDRLIDAAMKAHAAEIKTQALRNAKLVASALNAWTARGGR